MTKKNPGILIVIVLIAAFFLVITVFGAFYTVKENQFACKIRFSEIVSVSERAGLHFKIPLIDSVRHYPKQMLLYNLTSSEVLTKDSKAMTVDSYILWKIDNPVMFFETISTVSNAADRLDVITYNAFKVVIGTIDQINIISTDERSRAVLSNSVLDNVREAAEIFGIGVVDVQIKRFDLPPENAKYVYDRMIADRNQIAQKWLSEGEKSAAFIRNEVDRYVNTVISNAQAEARAIIAEGEAEYMKIMAEAFNTPERREFYTFMRGLEALQKSLGADDKVVILDADSELARILNNKK